MINNVDVYMVERTKQIIQATPNTWCLLEAIKKINRSALKLDANKITSWTHIEHLGVCIAIHSTRGLCMLIDEEDLDILTMYGFPSAKGNTYVTKFVSGQTCMHIAIARKHNVTLNGRYTPIHHINGNAFDNRKSNLVVAIGTQSHAYLHCTKGSEVNNRLIGKGNLAYFEIHIHKYSLNNVEFDV